MTTPTENTPSPLKSLREVANHYRIHEMTLYNIIKRNKLYISRIGSHYRFSQEQMESLEKWIA